MDRIHVHGIYNGMALQPPRCVESYSTCRATRLGGFQRPKAGAGCRSTAARRCQAASFAARVPTDGYVRPFVGPAEASSAGDDAIQEEWTRRRRKKKRNKEQALAHVKKDAVVRTAKYEVPCTPAKSQTITCFSCSLYISVPNSLYDVVR